MILDPYILRAHGFHLTKTGEQEDHVGAKIGLHLEELFLHMLFSLV